MKHLICILSFYWFGLHPSQSQTIKYCIPIDSIAYYSVVLNEYFPNQSQLIIAGENHGVNAANDAKIFYLYQYLLTHQKVTHLVWEAGPSFNWYLQRYLSTGDTLLFPKLTFNNALHTPTFFKALYALNQVEPIKTIGLDLDFWNNFQYPVECLKYIDSIHSYSSLTTHTIRLVLDSFSLVNQKKKLLLADRLIAIIHHDSSLLKTQYDQDYRAFSAIAHCLQKSLPIMDKEFFAFQREQYLTQQFQQQIVDKHIRAFAQYGDAHLPTSTMYIPFTQRIQKKQPLPIDIQPIQCLYINCKSSLGGTIKYSYSGSGDPFKNDELLKARLKSHKGNWLLLMEKENQTKELIIVTSNFN